MADYDPSYQRGKIYRLESLSSGLVYIGSTRSTLPKRLHGHRRKGNKCTSSLVLAHPDARILLIENYPCNSKNELRAREGHFQRTMDCVNKKIEGRTRKQHYQDNKQILLEKKKEYYEGNKQKILEKQKQYQQDNRERLLEKKKEYYQDNRETRIQYQKQHYQDNREAVKQRMKQYREDNRQAIHRYAKEKIRCECTELVNRGSIIRHRKSDKHKMYMDVIMQK